MVEDTPQLPLLQLFTRLREAGLPLGMEEYQLALQALQSGFGIADQDALARLCRTLWVKSTEDKLLFDYHFEQVMSEEAERIRAVESLNSAISSPESRSKYWVVRWWQRLSKRDRTLTLVSVGGTLVAATTAATLWLSKTQPQQACRPQFASTPVEEVTVDEEYIYNINVTYCQTDDSTLTIKAPLGLPSWLALTDNGNGTATLSGIPTNLEDGTVQLWDLEGNQQGILREQNQQIDNLSFSSDGRTIATISSDNTIRLWDPQGNQKDILEHSDEVYRVEFSLDGQHLITLSGEEKVTPESNIDRLGDIANTFRIWTIDGTLLITKKLDDGIDSATFNPDNQSFTTTSPEGTVRLWDLKGNQQFELKHPDGVYEVKFSPDGQNFTTALRNDTPQLWNLAQNQAIELEHPGQVSDLRSSSNGKNFVTVSNNRTVRLWNAEGNKLAELQFPATTAELDFSSDLSYLVAASDDGVIDLWRIEGNQFRKLQLPEEINTKTGDYWYEIFEFFTFSPDSRYITAASDNGVIDLWRIEGNQFRKLQLPEEINTKIEDYYRYGISGIPTFSPDSRYLTAASRDGTIDLWRVEGNQFRKLQLPEEINTKVENSEFFTFSPDSRYITAASDDGVISLWRLEGNRVQKLQPPEEINTKIQDYRYGDFDIPAFSPDGRYLKAVFRDGTVGLWRIEGNQFRKIALPEGSDEVVFSSDETHLITRSRTDSANFGFPFGFPIELPYRNFYSRRDRSYYQDYGYTFRLWKLEDDQLLERSLPEEIYGFTFLNDNQLVAISKNDIVGLWNLQKELLAKLELRGRGVVGYSPSRDSTVRFDLSGENLTTMTEDGVVRVWNRKGDQLEELNSQEQPSGVRFSPDGEHFITALTDNVVHLMDLEGNELADFRLEGKAFEGQFSLDGNHLTTVAQRNRVRWLDLEQNHLTELELLEPVDLIRVSQNQKYLVTVSEEQVQLWDSTGNQVVRWKHPDTISQLEISPTGEHIATLSSNGMMRLWSFEGEQIAEWESPVTLSSRSSLRFSPKGNYLTATDANSNNAYVWDLQGKQLETLEYLYYSYYAHFEFSPDGKYLATSSEGAAIQILNLEKNQKVELKYSTSIDELSFSPDSKHLIVALNDGTVQLQNLDGEQLAPQLERQNVDYEIKFSPDGNTFITASGEHVVYLKDLQGNQVATLNSEARIKSVDFSPDGKYVATSLEGNTLRVSDIQGNQLVELKRNDSIWKVSFSPDNQYLATLAGNTVNLLNLADKRSVDLKHEDRINRVAFSSDRNHLIVATDSDIQLWDLSGKLVTRVAIQSEVDLLDISPDGKYYIESEWSSSGEDSVHLRDLAGKVVAELGQPTRFSRATFSPDGKHIITLAGGTIRLWDLDGKKRIELTRPEHSGSFIEVQFSPNSEYFATREGSTVHLWNLDGDRLATLEQPTTITQLSFSSDSQRLVTAASSGTVSSWSLEGKLLEEQKPPQGLGEDTVYLAPDGRYYATSVRIDTIHLWDLNGNQQAEFELQGRVSDVAFSLDGRYLAAASKNHFARLWNLQGEQVADLNQHNGQIYAINFSPDSRNLITASGDGTARLWNMKGRQLATLWHQGWQVHEAEFVSNQRLVTTSEDNTVQLWDLKGNRLRELDLPVSFDLSDFSSDKHYSVAASTEEYTAALWNLSGTQLAELKLQEDSSQLQLSPDGENLTIGSEDTVNLWNIRTQQQISLPLKGEVSNNIRFSPNGQYLATVSDDDTYNVVLQVTDAFGNTSEQSFTVTAVPKPVSSTRELKDVDLSNYVIGSVLATLTLVGGYLFIRQKIRQNADQILSSDDNQSEQPTALPPSTHSNLIQELEDETQVVQALQHLTKNASDFSSNLVSETSEYFPVTRRQMKQNWRYLRRFIREGPPTELDVEATVKQIGRQGLLLESVLVPRRVNRTELLLMIDRDGSMVPFHALADRLVETAVQGGRLGRAGTYYFHNCPDQHLYHDPNHQNAEMVKDALSKIYSDFTGIIIFSDAGAARGGLNSERVELTAAFLDQLKQHVRYIAWLNPMPRSHWANTSAGEIARLVPMFEFNRQGMQAAISVLRGKLVHISA